MAISLHKGGRLSLSKEAPGLNLVHVGLGWDSRETDGVDFDLDASAFMLTATGRVRRDNEFIFYSQLTSPCGSVLHTGDNRTGDGDGDDEVLIVDLSKVPAEIEKITVTVTIHDAEQLKLNFGMVENAFIRLVNQESDQEILRFDLNEDYSTETAMVFGEIYRHNGEWKFNAVGQGYAGGLAAMCSQFGVQIS